MFFTFLFLLVLFIKEEFIKYQESSKDWREPVLSNTIKTFIARTLILTVVWGFTFLAANV